MKKMLIVVLSAALSSAVLAAEGQKVTLGVSGAV